MAPTAPAGRRRTVRGWRCGASRSRRLWRDWSELQADDLGLFKEDAVNNFSHMKSQEWSLSVDYMKPDEAPGGRPSTLLPSWGVHPSLNDSLSQVTQYIHLNICEIWAHNVLSLSVLCVIYISGIDDVSTDKHQSWRDPSELDYNKNPLPVFKKRPIREQKHYRYS